MADLPKATHTAEMSVMGIRLRVHVLDDGRRVIDAEDAHRFFAAMEDPNAPGAGEGEIARLVAALRGEQ